MNFRKIYEDYNVTYEKGKDGPFDEWETSIKSGKEQKPAIKGTPHFKYEKAGQPASNKPSCPYLEDTYNVKYSKSGSLTEKEFDELKKLKILTENFEDESEEFIIDEDDLDSDVDTILMDSEGYFGEDEEEIEDWERHEFDDFTSGDEEDFFDDDNDDFDLEKNNSSHFETIPSDDELFDDFEVEVEDYDPEDPNFEKNIKEYMNDGKGNYEDDFLSDEERHSSLGKINRGVDLFESISIKNSKLREFEIEDEENNYDDITDYDQDEYIKRAEEIEHRESIEKDPYKNLYLDLYDDE